MYCVIILTKIWIICINAAKIQSTCVVDEGKYLWFLVAYQPKFGTPPHTNTYNKIISILNEKYGDMYYLVTVRSKYL